MNINGMKILSIDDNSDDLLMIEEYSTSLSLEVNSFKDPEKALLSSQSIIYDLMIVNYRTPKPNALDFIRSFRQNISRDIPIIVLIKPEDNEELQVKALHLGAHDFLTKPIHPSLFQARVLNALKLKKAQTLLEDETFLLEDTIQSATDVLKKNEHESLQVLGMSSEYKDNTRGGHTLRIAHYCKVLAKEAGLSEKLQDIIFHSSQFHDLGNLGIADEILLKPNKLDEDELEIMKTHARKGYDMLKYSKSEYLKAGAVICYSHHEKFDGTGYPIGLSGDTIPIPGRIVAVADVFDALTSVRPYNQLWSIEDACKFLVKEKGKHFDPNFVDLFIENLDEIKSIKSKFI